MVGLAAAFWPLLRRDAVARFFALGMTLALIPCCATFPTDRLLMSVGVGAMGLLARFIGQYSRCQTPETPPSTTRRTKRWSCYALIAVHLVLAPILLPIRAYSVAILGNAIAESAGNAPLGDHVADQTVVLVNPPNFFFAHYVALLPAYLGKPAPAQVRSLAPNMGFLVRPIRVTRTDDRTLVYEPEGGFPWFLARDAAHPLPVGHKVELTGFTAEVLSLTPQSLPAKVAYRFDVPLEDRDLVWLRYEWNRYVPFTPPAVGETVILNEDLRPAGL
jgi:hypothetical protein